MGPKRIAMVVLGVTAAIVVVISVVAGAIVVLPHDNRYAVGLRPGESASSAPINTPSNSTTAAPAASNPATATPTPTKQNLPDPVLAAASLRVVPNKTAVAAKIRAIKV